MLDKVVIMKQTGPYTWLLVTPDGAEVSGLMYMPHAAAAEEWVQKFISTWPDWKYRVEQKDTR